jgi:hypothetical protein
LVPGKIHISIYSGVGRAILQPIAIVPGQMPLRSYFGYASAKSSAPAAQGSYLTRTFVPVVRDFTLIQLQSYVALAVFDKVISGHRKERLRAVLGCRSQAPECDRDLDRSSSHRKAGSADEDLFLT